MSNGIRFDRLSYLVKIGEKTFPRSFPIKHTITIKSETYTIKKLSLKDTNGAYMIVVEYVK